MNILKANHMKNWMSSPYLSDTKGISFEIGESIEEIEPDFFKLIPEIKELLVFNPGCSINMSAKEIQLFKENDVLIRGYFDSSAEAFAKENCLGFLHLDIELASSGSLEKTSGIDKLFLRFKEDGKVFIHLNNYSAGSSGGNLG